jgi:hypothetical protein
MYPFATPEGTVIHQSFSMAAAPRIGDEIDVDGVRCRRLATSDLIVSGADTNRRHPKYPYESYAMHRWKHMPKNVRSMTKPGRKGRVVIRSAKHEAEVCARLDRIIPD